MKNQAPGMIAHAFCGLLTLIVLVSNSADATNDCLTNCSFDGISGSISFYGCSLFDSDLVDVPACFEDFGKDHIEILDIGPGNLLTTLPQDFFDGLTSLRELEIRANYRMTSLPAGIFADLPLLETLTLYYNGLSEFPEGIFDNLPMLTTLSATHNDLTKLPDGAFSALNKLTTLDLSDNALASLPKAPFSNLRCLQFLDLGDNELVSIPIGAFSNLRRLQYLYLEDNLLTSLPHDSFLNLSDLSELRLAGNEGLQCLPNTTSPYISLDSDDIMEGTCVCEPAEVIDCAKRLTCHPGEEGYTCV